MIAVKCPSCGGNLDVPDNADIIVCEYCDNSVKVRDSIKIIQDDNTTNLLRIAEKAFEGGNYDEAYNYYNRVLEKDASNYLAWQGKGNIDLKQNNLSPMLTHYGEALKHCPTDKFNEVRTFITSSIILLVARRYEDSIAYVQKYSYDNNIWNHHQKEVVTLLELLKSVIISDEDCIPTLENVILICKYCQSNQRYVSPLQNGNVSINYRKFENINYFIELENWANNYLSEIESKTLTPSGIKELYDLNREKFYLLANYNHKHNLDFYNEHFAYILEEETQAKKRSALINSERNKKRNKVILISLTIFIILIILIIIINSI